MNVDSLLARSRPLFGQLVLYVLLLSALPLSAYFLMNHGGSHPRGERTGPATVLSWLPDSLLLNERVFQGCGVAFLIGAGLWLVRWWLPWSSWLAALAFNALVGLYLESASQATHVAHLTCQLLLVSALWYHFYADEMRSADRVGGFWRAALYPRWAYLLSVFVIGLFYGLSGLSKLLESGPGWANGTALQLWANLWGNPESLATRTILGDRRVAMLLQAVTLVGETSGLLAIVWPRARALVGLTLIAFHLGQIAVFGWGFHANMLLILLVLVVGPERAEQATQWFTGQRRPIRFPPKRLPTL